MIIIEIAVGLLLAYVLLYAVVGLGVMIVQLAGAIFIIMVSPLYFIWWLKDRIPRWRRRWAGK